MKRLACGACGQDLTNDEVAFNLHLNGHSATRFECLGCLAAGYGSTPASLREKMEMIKDGGCEFFKHQYVTQATTHN